MVFGKRQTACHFAGDYRRSPTRDNNSARTSATGDAAPRIDGMRTSSRSANSIGLSSALHSRRNLVPAGLLLVAAVLATGCAVDDGTHANAAIAPTSSSQDALRALTPAEIAPGAAPTTPMTARTHILRTASMSQSNRISRPLQPQSPGDASLHGSPMAVPL
jgi:hypothetical protein